MSYYCCVRGEAGGWVSHAERRCPLDSFCSCSGHPFLPSYITYPELLSTLTHVLNPQVTAKNEVLLARPAVCATTYHSYL